MQLRRRTTSVVMEALVLACTVVGVVALVSILGYVAVNGIPALNLDFFTQLPKPVGEPGGGMANAIGIFVYTLVVLPMRSFSALAGGIALGIIMIPTITRTTEEMLRLVPHSLREAGLALGIPQWRTTLSIVLPGAAGGILTGIMLAIARAGGETAPLLFTAFGNRFWHSGLDEPVAAMTLQIFNYAISPYDDWHAQAWAGSLVLVGIILVLSVAARYFTSRKRLS